MPFDSYIKPQPFAGMPASFSSCMPFDSYIKPQRSSKILICSSVVCLLIPTSNHNLLQNAHIGSKVVCLLIPTSNHNSALLKSLNWWVVCLLIPTSNHNFVFVNYCPTLLYAFWFLHQTTTPHSEWLSDNCCMPFDSYIKPQPVNQPLCDSVSCMPFDSYIKPQPYQGNSLQSHVVCLLIPTSNHNFQPQ